MSGSNSTYWFAQSLYPGLPTTRIPYATHNLRLAGVTSNSSRCEDPLPPAIFCQNVMECVSKRLTCRCRRESPPKRRQSEDGGHSCFRIRLPAQFIHKEAIIPAQQPARARESTRHGRQLHPIPVRIASVLLPRRQPRGRKVQAKFGKRGARIDLNPSLAGFRLISDCFITVEIDSTPKSSMYRGITCNAKRAVWPVVNCLSASGKGSSPSVAVVWCLRP